MSYRRQPTCSHCYGRGHTRRACPTMRERAAEAAKKPVAERDWIDQRAIDGIEELKASASTPRSCSYCGSTGHNMRGCVARKNDIAKTISRTIIFRKKFLEALKLNNFGVGAIISYHGYFSGFGYSRDNGGAHFLIVKSFSEDRIVPWNFYNKRSKLNDCVSAQHLKMLDDKYRGLMEVAVPTSVVSSIGSGYNDDSYNRTEIISGSAENGIDETQFVSWQSCETIVNRTFNEKNRNKVLDRRQLIGAGVISDETE